MSNNGIQTKVWGPPGWVFLQSICMGYPTKINKQNKEHIQRKKYTENFFKLVGEVLPCKYCRQSYKKFYKQLPIKNFLNSREELFRWIYEIHNKVNHKLGVPSCEIPSFDKVYSQYESYRAKCHKYTSKERKSRKEKGCTRPLHSKSKKKCIIKIISNNKSRKKSHKKSRKKSRKSRK